jgi:signal transduction histidine kinase/ligand-binding sensor domain-containing protein
MLRLRPSWLMLACVWLLATPARAGEPDRALSQYAHSAWRIQDGYLNGAPSAITQTADGYVWIGTSTGLVRSDGMRFVSWTPEDGNAWFSSSSIFSLLGGRDGSLWIGTGTNLARLKDGRLVNYTNAVGRINAIVEDRNGTVWITRSRVPDAAGPLCQVINETQQLRCYGTADGIASRTAGPLIAGPEEGTLWFGTSDALVEWNKNSGSGSARTHKPRELEVADGLGGVMTLGAAPDGSVWVAMSRIGQGLGLQRVQQGAWTPVAAPGLDGSGLVVNSIFMDRDNAMWIGTEGQGVYRLAAGRIDRLMRADGLSSDSVTDFYEDREGNMWIATSEGVDCLRKTRMISFSAREGLSANSVGALVAARDGTIWIANEGLDALRGRDVTTLRNQPGLPEDNLTSLLEDHAGRVWIGVGNGLSVYEQGRFRTVTRPDGSPPGPIIAMTEDRANNVWGIAVGNPRRLVRIENFTVREDIPAPRVPAASSVAADPVEGIWLGLDSGDLARYRQGRLETFRFTEGLRSAVRQVTAYPDGTTLGSTINGLIGWRNGTLRTLTPRNGLPCAPVHAFIFDAQRTLWLYTQCGLVSIAESELRKWWERGDTVVDVNVLDIFDGVRPALSPFQPRASRSPDGRLWFANETVVQTIDPTHQVRNTIPPPVHIEQVIADRKRYPARQVVHLPPLTGDLQIDYVGLSFVAPQKVRFRYRLEGRDQTWQEPGMRRQAFYNDLRPGTYRFRVMASNNDGLWNEQGATLEIVIAPAWYQTRAFLMLCVVSAIVAVWAIYQLRMRQLARALNARFDERLAERTRMARDLHDTLLQTVQGSKMVVDNALNQRDDTGMRQAMEQVSVWLGHASTEGRAAVIALRTSTTEKNDLAEAFRRALEDCGRQGSQTGSLAVTGSAKEMHPVVRDEVYRIGYEAIRNACTHSGGSRLQVGLTYARDLTLRIADNGTGMDPAIANSGRDGHFGLQGMRERATRIGARLTVETKAGAGTEITLVVPGRIIFQHDGAGLFARMRARFTS